MDKNEAKCLSDLYAALAAGKTLQYKHKDIGWVDQNIESIPGSINCKDWRVKKGPREHITHLNCSDHGGLTYVYCPADWANVKQVKVIEILERDPNEKD